MLRRLFSRLRRILQLCCSPYFSDLPYELLLLVASYLDVPDLNSLLRTSRLFKLLITPVLIARAATTPLPRGYGRQQPSVLHWAVCRNRSSLLQALLSQGAHHFINIPWIGEITPLQSAVMLGHEEPVRILLENGADPEALNRSGWTALMTAVIGNNYQLCVLLLDYGAQIDAKGMNIGWMNAIHYAAGLGRLPILELLVERGCNTGSINQFGANPVSTALVCGQEAIVQRMVQQGLKVNKYPSEWERCHLRWAIERVHGRLALMLSEDVHNPFRRRF